jgi:uncharacterized phage-associated protein
MKLRFNFEKSLQAAAVLLHLEGKRMSRLRLLKLLYIADREMLAEIGQSITGDTAYAMDHGPVLSCVYNCIKGDHYRAGEWDEFIHSDGNAVVFVKEPGRGKLAPVEIDKLTMVSEKYRSWDEWEISNETHTFEEWKKHSDRGSSAPIPWEDILKAQHKEEMADVVQEGEAIRRALSDAFGD